MTTLITNKDQYLEFVSDTQSSGKTIGRVGVVNDGKGDIVLGHYSIADKISHIVDIVVLCIHPVSVLANNRYFTVEGMKFLLHRTKNINADVVYVEETDIKMSLNISSGNPTYLNGTSCGCPYTGWFDDYLKQETNLHMFLEPLNMEFFDIHRNSFESMFINKLNMTVGRGYKDFFQDMMITGVQGFEHCPYENTWMRTVAKNTPKMFFDMFRDLDGSTFLKNNNKYDNMRFIIKRLLPLNVEEMTINDLETTIECHIETYYGDKRPTFTICNIFNGKKATDEHLQSKQAIVLFKIDNVFTYFWPGFEEDDYFEIYPDFKFKKIPNYIPFNFNILPECITGVPFYDNIKEGLIKSEFVRRFNEKRGVV